MDVTAIAEHQTYHGILAAWDTTALCEAAETGKDVLCAKASPQRYLSWISDFSFWRHYTAHRFLAGQLRSSAALRIILEGA